MQQPPNPPSTRPLLIIVLTFFGLLALALHSNRDGPLIIAQEGQPESRTDACAASFPVVQRSHFLPIIFQDGEPPARAVVESPAPLEKTSGRLVPIGDELGDVGQYYSSIAPSLDSRIILTNRSDSTREFSLTLYGDTGYRARTLNSCQIDAVETLSLAVDDGQLALYRGSQRLDLSAVCEEVVVHETRGAPTEPPLHGLYQAQISADEGGALDVRIESATDANHPQIAHHAAATYSAIAAGNASAIVQLPGIIATRDLDNWWDTEIVVQNVGDHPVELQFRLFSEGGDAFQNNSARLNAHERRIFLASQLLNANDLNTEGDARADGFLYERSGWHAATLIALPVANASQSARVAVLTNIFKQPADETIARPRAELGSECLVQFGPPRTTAQLTYLLPAGAPRMTRIFNASANPNTVTLTLFDADGRAIGMVERQLAPHVIWAFSDDQLGTFPLTTATIPGTVPGTIPGTVPGVVGSADEMSMLQITGDEPLNALIWNGARIVKSQQQEEEADVWYVPLMGAPAVPFRWDDDASDDPLRADHPGAGYGIVETGIHSERPDWERSMNWYNWGAARDACNQPVSEAKPFSTYIPMIRGLGDCNGRTGRDCVNTDERLSRVRNNIPSSCAGRPLFLINEPDLRSQTYMTYHELGRMVYLMRQWPGELYSPVFASQYYDRPTYPAESDPWCRVPENLASCPDGLYCDRCKQDGIEDGETDPFDISFAGLEAYFGAPGRWAQGQAWAFDKVVEGMLLHVYLPVESFTPEALGGAPHWRAAMLRQFRDRAVEAGWPIIVKEYGFVTWPDGDGIRPNVDPQVLATRVDDFRRLLQENLSNDKASDEGGGLMKLFWFHTGCGESDYFEIYESLCLFKARDSDQLSYPMGECWHKDAVMESDEDTVCGVSRQYLPFIER